MVHSDGRTNWERFPLNIAIKNRQLNPDFRAGWLWNDINDIFVDHWVDVQETTFGKDLMDGKPFC